jgi:hypothetical protein
MLVPPRPELGFPVPRQVRDPRPIGPRHRGRRCAEASSMASSSARNCRARIPAPIGGSITSGSKISVTHPRCGRCVPVCRKPGSQRPPHRGERLRPLVARGFAPPRSWIRHTCSEDSQLPKLIARVRFPSPAPQAPPQVRGCFLTWGGVVSAVQHRGTGPTWPQAMPSMAPSMPQARRRSAREVDH